MTVNRVARALALGALGLLAPTACSLFERHTAPASGNDVREYLGAAARRTALPDRVDDQPRVIWEAPGGRGSAGAVAAGERVIGLTTIDRRVVALDTRTGRLFWQWRGGNTFAAGPAIGDGMLFAASEGEGGTVTALVLSSGRRLWYHRVGDVRSPLVLRHGRVYGATTAGAVFAFDAVSGRRAWMYRIGPTRTGPAVLGDRVVIVTTTDSLVVLDAGTGRQVTRAALPATSVAPLATLDDSTIVLAAPTGSVVAVAIPGGDVRWQVATGGALFGAPVVSRDTVFALTNECALWAIPVAEPHSATSVPLGCVTKTAPAIVRDGVLVATVGGTLELYGRPGGRLRWADTLRSEIRHPPMIVNGQIIVAPTIGDVVSYR